MKKTISQKHRKAIKRATARYIGSRTAAPMVEWPSIRWDVICMVLICLNLL